MTSMTRAWEPFPRRSGWGERRRRGIAGRAPAGANEHVQLPAAPGCKFNLGIRRSAGRAGLGAGLSRSGGARGPMRGEDIPTRRGRRRGAESKPIGRLWPCLLPIAGAGGAGPFSFRRARGTMRGDIPTHRRHLAGGKAVNGRGFAGCETGRRYSIQPEFGFAGFFQKTKVSGS